MKILCLSDLHIQEINSLQLNRIKYIIEDTLPDVIIICGDIFDNGLINPYKELSMLGDLPIICVLGNHEFATFRSIDITLNRYTKLYEPNKYNVHYLDIIGHKCIENINFVGNVLWYDGSLKSLPNQSDIIIDGWLDSIIEDFDFKKENLKCINQIKQNIDNNKINILLTHCVPHIDMNLFSLTSTSLYNMYSGVKNLFNELPKLDYAICGHTHRYTVKEIAGCNCINVGNDYYQYTNDIKYYILEV